MRKTPGPIKGPRQPQQPRQPAAPKPPRGPRPPKETTAPETVQKKRATLPQDQPTEAKPHRSTQANAPETVQPQNTRHRQIERHQKATAPDPHAPQAGQHGRIRSIQCGGARAARSRPHCAHVTTSAPPAVRPRAPLRKKTPLRKRSAPGCQPAKRARRQSRAASGRSGSLPSRCKCSSGRQLGGGKPASQPVPVPTNAAATARPSQPAGSLRRKRRG